MGVLGLTSYISLREDIFFEKYQLKNCHLIIDGYSLAATLFLNCPKTNPSFGGDYDKYSNVVGKFVKLLRDCKVTPIVICDGGRERKKLHTVRRRMLNKVFVYKKITPASQHKQAFPLMMWHEFREKLLSMNVCLLQSDFEADREIAALGKQLGIPVLSNDSDFFIFDVQYIPMSSMSFRNYEMNADKECYIPCRIFSRSKLINNFSLGGSLIPLLATLLGNDYISASQFKMFYNQLKMDQSKALRPGQKRVRSLLQWLGHETFESALQKILNSVKKRSRQTIKKQIQRSIKGYVELSTPLYNYLPNDIRSKYKPDGSDILEQIEQLSKLSITNGDDESDTQDSCDLDESDNEDISKESEISEGEETDPKVSDGEESEEEKIDFKESEEEKIDFRESEEEEINSKINDDIEELTIFCKHKSINEFPLWFLDEFRKGNISPNISTLLTLGLYFFTPQVEDYKLQCSCICALPILNGIIGLLNLDKITYWARHQNHYRGTVLIFSKEDIKFNLLNFDKLCDLTVSQRQHIIFEALQVDNKLGISKFPEDWQLYLMSISYWIKASDITVKPCHLHALIMTLITVNVIRKKIDPVWLKPTFMKRYGSKLKYLNKRPFHKQTPKYFDSVADAINAISENDCILAMEVLISYFHIDNNLYHRSNKFSTRVVHLYAQLQNAFECAVDLNSLLLLPFNRSNMGMFYNGTFLYNLTINFVKRSNILSYIENQLTKVPAILNLYRTVYSKLCEFIPSVPKQKIRVKRPNREKTSPKETAKAETAKNYSGEELSDDEGYVDKNNKFSLLRKPIR